MNPYEQIYDVDLSKGITQKDIGTLVFEGDNNSIKVGSNVYNSGVPQQLSGSIEGKVIRQDGGTVYYVGTISDNTGYITLTEAAFAYPGPIEIFVRIVSGQDKITIGAFKAKAKRTDTGKAIDPGQPVPGIAELAEDVAELKTGKKNTQSAVSSPSSSGNALAFIDTISQNEQGVIRPTKKYVTVDATPTANSTNPVTSGGVKAALDSKQNTLTFDSVPTANSNNPVKSSGIKEGLDEKLNAFGKGINLLDNWYFIGGGSQQGGGQFPINQRGQTSYTGATYMIDRWKSNQNDQYIRIGNNCITLGVCTTNNVIGQTIKNLPAGTYIFSALISRSTKLNSLSTPDGYWITNFSAGTNTRLVSAVYTTDSPVTNARFGFCARGDSLGEITEIDVIAVKLELGDTQTLAHQENGEWVLNDPQPNYDMELLKCQLSTADSSDTYANRKLIPITANMGTVTGTGDTVTVTKSVTGVTGSMTVDRIEFGTPSAVQSGWTVTTAADSITFSAVISGSTTVKIKVSDNTDITGT